jgi:toxin-antitoxin system PIN domain toxin
LKDQTLSKERAGRASSFEPKSPSSAPAPRPYTPTVPRPPLLAREAPGLPWPLRHGGVQGDLPDLNVWLALAVEEHPHHAVAARYWTEAQSRPSSPQALSGAAPAARLWFCRTTMLGLVRLLCQPKVVGKGALALSDALAVYQRFRALTCVGLLPEPEGSDVELLALVTARVMPPRLWTDAWLAAQAKASGLRLVSFDADFLRFGLEHCEILPPQ